MVRDVFLLLPAALSLGGATAHAGTGADRGSTRVAATQDGVILTTSTADRGAMRCVAVRGLVSGCRRGDGAGPHLIQHAVPRTGRPRLGRLVVAAMEGSDAVRVRVRLGNDVRTLTPGRFGAWLAVYPARARQRDLVFTVRYRDGRERTTDYRRSSERWRPVRGSDRVERELRDPVSGMNFGQLVWRTVSGQTCQQVGALLGGRVGTRFPGIFMEYLTNAGGSCAQVDAETFAPSLLTERSRLVLAGFAGRGITQVEARIGEEPPMELRRSASGAFALIRRVNGDAPEVVVTATLPGGNRVTQEFPPQSS